MNLDRRRGADARDVALEISESMIHVALVVRNDGSEPEKVVTRSIAWKKESTTLYSELGAQELAEAVGKLVAEERLAGAQVHIALSGEFCVTRVVIGSTEDVRRELVELEGRSHRYLTLGPGPKTIAGSVQQLDARHQHAMLTVANQKTLDAILRMAEAVGIQIATIEPSLIALARAQALIGDATGEACLVIELSSGGAELGICHDGRLLLDYRPGGHTNATNVADVIAQHLTRVQRYLDRHHRYLKSPVKQVYLAGDADAVAQAQRQFARFEQFQAVPLNPGQLKAKWQHIGASPGPELAAALGTALIDYQTDASERTPNLMERILAESREPMRPILVRSLLPLAAVLLVALGMFALHQAQHHENAALQAQLDELEPVRAQARVTELTLSVAEHKLAELKQLESRLPRANWGRLLTRIAQSMPEDVWLDGLVVQDTHLARLTGASYADSGVYDFVGYLKQVPDIAQIALEGTGTGRSQTGPTTSFELQLSLSPESNPAGQEVHHD
ncbi:MAG TPA: PilN domain-containing protein [Lacipirellulaceae bacterium]